MSSKLQKFKCNQITLSLAIALTSVGSVGVVNAADEEQLMEEVVATASRLKGSATAVIEERKQQAFVADILGADQISRTGDSDAASALRRVTGLTLVDGKYIYVRGLGERYSSVRLNGASIPSPDLTRNIIPLDIFPSNMIESLSVQKAYSPAMPAAFGGGDIDIRTKSVPSEEKLTLEAGLGFTTASTEGYTYEGGDDDWLGTDDGSRGMSSRISNALSRYHDGKSNLSVRVIRDTELKQSGTDIGQDAAVAINKDLAKSLNRDYRLQKTDIAIPEGGASAQYGNVYDDLFGFGGEFGFLGSLNYDNSWKVDKEFVGEVSSPDVENCSVDSVDCYSTYEKKEKTTNNIKINSIVNLGYKLDGHNLVFSNFFIRDSEDEAEWGVYQEPSKGLSFDQNQVERNQTTSFEERELTINQLRGTHNLNFDFIDGLGVDWHFTDSEATTSIPGELSIAVRERYNNGAYDSTFVNGNLIATPYQYRFVGLEDTVENWGYNVSLPVYTESFEMEFKVGGNFIKKARQYRTDFIGFTLSQSEEIVITETETEADAIGSVGGYFRDDSVVDATNFELQFNEPDTDDYVAGQIIDAYYGSFDVMYDSKWRFSGGLRYENFRQVSAAFSQSIFDKALLDAQLSEEKLQEATVTEDKVYPSLSLTYSPSETYQIRVGYGETVVRPDFREISPVQYTDPLTNYRIKGSSLLESSDLKNYDARVEFYFDNGDNLSFATFYKDITNPIEVISTESDGRVTQQFGNAESATVYGLESEWLFELTGNFYTSGNVTLSDSEVTVSELFAGDATNPTRRMNGHSEYVVNAQLNFDSDDGEHTASLVYNVFGERILVSGTNGLDEAYENPFHSFDAVYTYYPTFDTNVKFKIKNLFGQDFEVEQNGAIVRQREVGTGFSASFTWEM